MKIGELAKATGLTTKTIRFYEDQELLPKPPRTTSGYRAYGSDDLVRLELIRKAKRLGLSLEEIRGILQLHDLREPTCVHVRSLLDQKIIQIDRVLKDLQEFRSELAFLKEKAGDLEDCRPSGGNICGIIEQSGLRVSSGALPWFERTPSSKADP